MISRGDFCRLDGTNRSIQFGCCQLLSATSTAQRNVHLHLEEQTIARLLLDSGLDTGRVGDGEIVTDDLDAGSSGEVGPRLPVILVEGIFDRDLRILQHQRSRSRL